MRIYGGLRHRGRAVAVLLLCLHLPACAGGWKVTQAEPAQYIAQKKPASVRVTTDSATMVLHRPHVAGDSVLGTTLTPGGLAAQREDSTGIALASIRKLEVPQGTSTAVMVVVGVAFMAGLIALLSTTWTIDLGG